MKAAVFHGPRDVRIEDVPDSAVRDPGDVVLEVTRAAICGTDAAEWDHGPVLCRPGVILGHEFVGRVVDLGKDVTTLSVGDARRLGSWDLLRSLPLVPHWSYQPLRRLPHTGAPGRRRTCRVCDDSREHLPRRPRDLRRRRGCHGTATRRRPARPVPGRATSGRRRCRDRSRRYRLVHRRWCITPYREGRVVAVDIDDERLATASALGAHQAANPNGHDLAELLLELSDGVGFDVVIEASGAPHAPAAAVAGARRGGSVLLVGLHSAPRVMDLTPMIVREIDIVTTVAHVCDSDIPAALRLALTQRRRRYHRRAADRARRARRGRSTPARRAAGDRQDPGDASASSTPLRPGDRRRSGCTRPRRGSRHLRSPRS